MDRSFYALLTGRFHWEENMHRLPNSAAAIRRLTEIEAEIARIVDVFPELRRSARIPARLQLTSRRPRPNHTGQAAAYRRTA